jgi:parallel beta-helix repeat protein
MEKKTASAIMLTLLLTSMLTLALNIQPAKAEPTTIIVPDDYPTIQEAINVANPSDMIYVRSGTYYENVVINKSISLIGEKREGTIIDGGKKSATVNVTVSATLIKNFTIRNGGDGILCYGSYHVIQNNTVTDNTGYGIFLGGVSWSTISENDITQNGMGTWIVGFNNTLRNNHMNQNKYNFGVGGFELSSFIHNIDSSNTIDGNPIYYLINKKDLLIDPSAFPKVGYLGIVNSTNIVVQKLNLKNNIQGILFAHTNNSLIKCNNITDNSVGIEFRGASHNIVTTNIVTDNNYGIDIEFSPSINNTISSNLVRKNEEFSIGMGRASYNTISANNITDSLRGLFIYDSSNNKIIQNLINNTEKGIWFYYSSTNYVYHNNFLNNKYQVWTEFPDPVAINIWDDGYPSGGNYWSDYAVSDELSGPNQDVPGSDGIGDTPYVIDSWNRDRYPLMFPYSAPDISIVNVSPCTAAVYHSYPVFIGATVENKGNKTESVQVDFYANATLVGAQNVTVPLHANRTITTMWNTIGFSGQYTISAYAEPLQGEINTSNNRLTDGHVDVMGKGYFIIVAGNNYDNNLLPTINYGCNQVYKILRKVGYTADNIYYLNQPECGYQDIDGDGKNDIDAWASNANLSWAIESWAASRVSPTQPLYLYLFDHGGSDIFCINNAPEYLYSSQLALWLDNLARSTGAPIHVIYAACHSGSFVDELSKAGRVIITSSKADEYSYTIPGTWEAFSTPFWNQIKSGHSMGSSFNYASSPLSFAGWLWRLYYWLFGIHQTPLLDDNGDGVGHAGHLPNAGDGYLANSIYIGACEWPYPWISQVMPGLFSYWPPQSNITLWAKVENNSNLLHVRAYMLPPDWMPPNSTDTLLTLGTECYEMTDLDNDGNWTVNIPIVNFTNHAPESAQTANFTFFITAEQDNGDMATPLAANVRFSKTLDPGIDEIPPYVSIERPLENRIVSNLITVNGTALDDICLKRIEVYVDDNLCGTTSLPNASSSFYEFNLDTTLFENGNRTITVKAFDMADNCCNQTLNVVFMNFVHDTAVTDVEPGKRIVGQGFVSSINVTVANHGSYPEDINITVYANETCIASQTLFLSNGNYTNMIFNWDTTGFAKGNYTISAVADTVPGETYTEDNTLINGIVTVTISGDLNGDLKVSLADLVILAIAYDSRPGDTRWNPNADIDDNSVVGLSDLVILANHYGQPLP